MGQDPGGRRGSNGTSQARVAGEQWAGQYSVRDAAFFGFAGPGGEKERSIVDASSRAAAQCQLRGMPYRVLPESCTITDPSIDSLVPRAETSRPPEVRPRVSGLIFRERPFSAAHENDPEIDGVTEVTLLLAQR